MKELRVCSIEGCGELHCAKGLCRYHYNKQHWQLPETKQKLKEYYLRPEFKKHYSEYYMRTDVQQKRAKSRMARRERINASAKITRKSWRLKALDFYSNGTMQCACCGEKIIEFLEIDHVKNDGAEHRRKLGVSAIYHWINKNNFPNNVRLQVLCSNCNQGKRMCNGICPHEKIQKESVDNLSNGVVV